MRPIRRVLLVLQSVMVGGLETHSLYLGHELVRRGIEVIAVVPHWPEFDDLARRFTAGGVPVVRLTTTARGKGDAEFHSWRMLSILWRGWKLFRLARRFQPDVVHLHTPGATGGLALFLIARLSSRVTVVVTEHEVPPRLLRGWDRRSRLMLDRMMHAVVAVSRRNAALRRQSLGVAPRVFASVLNGIPIARVTPQQRAGNLDSVRRQLGLSDGTVLIGSVVRLVEGKGLDDLIRAFAIVERRSASALVLVGGGPLRSELEALARELGVATSVHFVGNQPAPDIFLDAIDIFALAVPAGSMSIALLEAMGRGLPCVITFCGPEEPVIPEVTGLCARPNDPDDLAESLLRLAHDSSLRERLGAAAAEHVRRHFSAQRVADDLLELYSSARSGRIPVRLRADSTPASLIGESPSQSLTP